MFPTDALVALGFEGDGGLGRRSVVVHAANLLASAITFASEFDVHSIR
jgi:hypothetical protein